MSPTDPRHRPDLDVARPDDFTGATREEMADPEPWLVLFGDHEEYPAQLRGRWTTPAGRIIVELVWHAEVGRWDETYFADRAKMRKNW